MEEVVVSCICCGTSVTLEYKIGTFRCQECQKRFYRWYDDIEENYKIGNLPDEKEN